MPYLHLSIIKKRFPSLWNSIQICLNGDNIKMQKYLVGILKESKNPTRSTKSIGSYQHLFKFQDKKERKRECDWEGRRERENER